MMKDNKYYNEDTGNEVFSREDTQRNEEWVDPHRRVDLTIKNYSAIDPKKIKLVEFGDNEEKKSKLDKFNDALSLDGGKKLLKNIKSSFKNRKKKSSSSNKTSAPRRRRRRLNEEEIEERFNKHKKLTLLVKILILLIVIMIGLEGYGLYKDHTTSNPANSNQTVYTYLDNNAKISMDKEDYMDYLGLLDYDEETSFEMSTKKEPKLLNTSSDSKNNYYFIRFYINKESKSKSENKFSVEERSTVAVIAKDSTTGEYSFMIPSDAHTKDLTELFDKTKKGSYEYNDLDKYDVTLSSTNEKEAPIIKAIIYSGIKLGLLDKDSKLSL